MTWEYGQHLDWGEDTDEPVPCGVCDRASRPSEGCVACGDPFDLTDRLGPRYVAKVTDRDRILRDRQEGST